jgi:hypothetical protein
MEFLKGLLSGKSAISEIIENQIFLFGWTDMPGMCYLVDSDQLMSYLPVIENSEPILYSKEAIDRMKKIPGYYCCIKEFRPGDKGETYRARLAAALEWYNTKNLIPDC